MQHDLSCIQTVLYIDHFLIRASFPVQLCIFLCRLKLAVYDHIQIRNDLFILDLTPLISGVQPLGLFRKFLPDFFGQLCDFFSVSRKQRISSTVGDPADIAFFQLLKQLFFASSSNRSPPSGSQVTGF